VNPILHVKDSVLFSSLPYTNWTDIYNAMTPEYQATVDSGVWNWGNSDAYPFYHAGAAAFGVGTADGEAAYNVIRIARSRSIQAQTTMSTDPKWAIDAYHDPVQVLSVSPEGTSVTIKYVKPRADVACTVDGVSDGVTNSRTVSFTKTGLNPNSTHNFRIHCADDPYTRGNTSIGMKAGGRAR
jgi:hypothetical protein